MTRYKGVVFQVMAQAPGMKNPFVVARFTKHEDADQFKREQKAGQNLFIKSDVIDFIVYENMDEVYVLQEVDLAAKAREKLTEGEIEALLNEHRDAREHEYVIFRLFKMNGSVTRKRIESFDKFFVANNRIKELELMHPGAIYAIQERPK